MREPKGWIELIAAILSHFAARCHVAINGLTENRSRRARTACTRTDRNLRKRKSTHP